MFGYMAELGAYTFGAHGGLDVQRRAWNTGVWFDGGSGELLRAFTPSGEHTGNTVEWWLRALHFADVFGWLSYRILVCALGLIIVFLSVTGAYIRWKKRRARRSHRRSGGTPVLGGAEDNTHGKSDAYDQRRYARLAQLASQRKALRLAPQADT